MPKGITNVVKIADKLAKYGRNEDEYMVHAARADSARWKFSSKTPH